MREKNLKELQDKTALASVPKKLTPTQKRGDGSPTSLRFGVNMYFKAKGTDIIIDPEFAEASKVFLAKYVD